MKLTPSQSKALSIHRHLAIVANAGSGKTRVLVKRYVDLLELRPELHTRNVIAITFTESAAAELRTRITKEVAQRIAALDESAIARRIRLHEIRDSLSNAFIGTIHAFASRIIRAYPVEANVDAGFGVLSGADQRLLVEDAIGRVFYSTLELAYGSDQSSPMLELFRKFGRRDLAALVRTMIGNRSRSEAIVLELLSLPESQILDNWQSQFEKLIRLPFAQSTHDAFQILLSYAKKASLGKAAHAAYDNFKRSVGFFETCSSFKDAAASMFTQKHDIRSQAIDKAKLTAEEAEQVAKFVLKLQNLSDLLLLFPASRDEFDSRHTGYISDLRLIFELYHTVLEAYTENKTAYGLLDFDDLIQHLQSLLQEPRVRTELSAQFSYMMIDEYQDTDENQFEIARLISENFGIKNNVAVVGDPKQSIYTFRNADASIFRKTRTAITAQALTEQSLTESETLKLAPEEEQGEISLRESFRMASTPLAFINRVFASVMQPTSNADFATEEVEHSPLVLGRASELAGSVEWICPFETPQYSDNEETDEDEETQEVTLIAQKIKQIVHDTTGKYQIEVDNELRAPSYGNIAILLRSRTNLASLEKALRSLDVPYQVSKGAGFYSQQEIIDIASYLKFLVMSSDDISLAAILRSPFFALSDVDLYQIAFHGSELKKHSEDPISFYEQLQSYANATHKPHLHRAVSQIRENLTLVGRTGSALLVEKIYAETGIFATLGAGPNAQQKISNLDKFLAQARESDIGGFSSLFDFVDRIHYLIEENDNEAQADLSTAGNAVQILTVHGSKGLEFPIVFVPFLQKAFKFDHTRLLDKDLGLLLSYPDAEKKPLVSEIIRLRARENTIAEEKRILYVALTRTRDHLILSSTIKDRVAKGDSWLRWITDAIPAITQPDLKAIPLAEKIERYDNDSQVVTSELVEFEIPIIRSSADIPKTDTTIEETEATTIGKTFLMPLPVLHPKDRFSATQFLTLKQCPTKYHLSYVLGIPEEPKLAFDMEADQYSETVRGKMLGQVVHRLFDKIDSLTNAGHLNTERFEREIENIFFSLSIWLPEEQDQYRKESEKHLQNFLTSKFALDVFAGTETRTEYPAQTQFLTGDILYGIIDRLYLAPNGIWTILDYKTDSVTTRDKYREEKRARYEFQMKFYAYLVSLHFPNVEQVRTVLFYTSTGTLDSKTFIKEDFNGLLTECTELIGQVRRNDRVKDLESLPRYESHCPDCSFFDTARTRCVVLSAGMSEADRYSSKIAELA